MSLITGDGTVFEGERKILLEERTVTVQVAVEQEVKPIKAKVEWENKQETLRLYMYPDGTMRYE